MIFFGSVTPFSFVLRQRVLPRPLPLSQAVGK
jgi:hypothetical protein